MYQELPNFQTFPQKLTTFACPEHFEVINENYYSNEPRFQ